MNIRLGSLLAALILQGCASLVTTDYQTLQTELDPLLPTSAQGVLATLPDLTEQERHTQIQALLNEPLSVERAVQLTLINSPRIRAELATLGIAEAEQLQARLLRNPTLAVGALRPEGGGRWQLDLGLSQSLLDLMTRSLRHQLAEEALAQAKLYLLESINREIAVTQQRYYQALGSKHRATLADLSLQAASASDALAGSLYTAGNIKALTRLHYQDYRQKQERVLRRAHTDAQLAHLQLAQQLGLSDSHALILPEALPRLPDDTRLPDADTLITQALTQRLDVRLAHQQQHIRERQLAFQQGNRTFTQLDIGINAERETDGSWMFGPELAISLPVFDRNQAHITAAQARISQQQTQTQALALQVRTDILGLLLKLENTLVDIHQLEQQVIPQWQTRVELSLKEYNFMLASAFDLLSAKSREFEAWQEHAQALQDYWLHRSALAFASASPLPTTTDTPVALPVTHSEDSHDHHPHHTLPDHDHGKQEHNGMNQGNANTHLHDHHGDHHHD